jgi:2-dehydro-3-deoxyphosphogluconate aldolase/(4S)-4-hydroxy-2-oxoglutarate aldolase
MNDIAAQLGHARMIAIIRTDSSDHLLDAARALRAGGIAAMEITLNTPGALPAIARIRAELPEMLCGAGTILTPADAIAAMQAGAQFIITPTLQLDTVALCTARKMPVAPGCASPTEALAAHRAGADFIKVFPSATFALVHIREMLEEIPQLNLVPTGGITPENLHQFFEVGCKAVAAGSTLISKDILRNRDWNALTAAARRFVEAIDRIR